MIHRMADVQAAPEQVVSVTAFEYDAQGGPSRLTRVHRTGWRTRPDGTAYPKSLPSIDLTYTDWRPGAARIAPLRNREPPVQIGRAHVCTPVTNTHPVCRSPPAQTTTQH